jgi:hypothetical protein
MDLLYSVIVEWKARNLSKKERGEGGEVERERDRETERERQEGAKCEA